MARITLFWLELLSFG